MMFIALKDIGLVDAIRYFTDTEKAKSFEQENLNLETDIFDFSRVFISVDYKGLLLGMK